MAHNEWYYLWLIKQLQWEVRVLEKEKDVVSSAVSAQRDWLTLIHEDIKLADDEYDTKLKRIEDMRISYSNFCKLHNAWKESKDWLLISLDNKIARKKDELDELNSIEVVDYKWINKKYNDKLAKKLLEVQNFEAELSDVKKEIEDFKEYKAIAELTLAEHQKAAKLVDEQLSARAAKISKREQKLEKDKKWPKNIKK